MKNLKIFEVSYLFNRLFRKKTIWHYYILELLLAILLIAALFYLLFI
jgi:hypothetical protein